jgi:membrane protease YdiL (CAAX protease family)
LIFLFSIFFGFFGLRLANWVLSLIPGIGSIELTVMLTAGFLQGILMVAFVLFAVRIRKATLAALGVGSINLRNILLYGVLGGTGVFLLVTILMAIIISFLPQTPEPQAVADLLLNARGREQIVSLLLLVGVIAPVSEELFFRGFIYPVMRNRLGVNGGITATACLFGLMHFDLVRFIPLAIGGACLNIFCENSNSIYPAIVAHSMWNTVMALIVIVFNMTL